MALKPRRPRVWLSRLHLLLRLIGLTGLVVVAGAAVLAQVQGMFGTDERPWREALTAVGDRLGAALQGRVEGDVVPRTGA